MDFFYISICRMTTDEKRKSIHGKLSLFTRWFFVIQKYLQNTLHTEEKMCRTLLTSCFCVVVAFSVTLCVLIYKETKFVDHIRSNWTKKNTTAKNKMKKNVYNNKNERYLAASGSWLSEIYKNKTINAFELNSCISL